MREPIRRVARKDGTTAYRLVVDAGKHSDGRRRQLTATFDRLRDARSELARVRHEIDLGTYIAPSDEPSANTWADSSDRRNTRWVRGLRWRVAEGRVGRRWVMSGFGLRC
jgi:hypothetical protein